MSEQNIHPDFRKLPAFELPFKRPFMQFFMNAGLDLAGAIKFSKYKKDVLREKIIGPDGHHIPLWMVRPEHVTKPAAVLVYFHGGGFVLKQSPQHIEYIVRYAHEANCCVVFVDYRMSPKHAFPAAFDDCHGTLTWAFQNAEKLGFDKQRIAVGGDSAGAALAASVAQKAAHGTGLKLCGQLLVYPVTDSDGKSASSAAFGEIAPFKRFSVQVMWEAYLGQPAGKATPTYASPLHGKLTGLAPAYVETAEFDPLRDEGIAYAEALVANGVDVTLNNTRGTVHGYDLVAVNSELTQQALQRRVQFLRGIFQPAA